MNRKKLILFLLIHPAITFLLGNGTGSLLNVPDTITHPHSFHHPGLKEGEQNQYTLTELRHPYPDSTRFYLDVKSTFCGDGVCKIVPVRLWWNLIGEYVHYELKSNDYLEKDPGNAFTKQDYQHLHTILQRLNSAYATLHISELTGNNVHDEVDAIAGATTVTIDSAEVVQGAIWTCYTLWHWAQGSVCDTIRCISAKHLDTGQLLRLTANSGSYQQFVIDVFKLREIYDSATIQSVLKLIPEIYPEAEKTLFQYLENAPQDQYKQAIFQILHTGTSHQKHASIQSLAKMEINLTDKEALQLTMHLNYSTPYAEVNAVLNLLEQQDRVPNEVLEQIARLLKQDILIARRAYYFLVHRDTTGKWCKELDRFYRRNKSNL